MALLQKFVARTQCTRHLLSSMTRSFRELTRITGSAANYSAIVSSNLDFIPEVTQNDVTKEKLSRAALVYLEKARQYDEMMENARDEYKSGMRHLANMMGADPETFTQADANAAIEYLFPSGVYDKKARPFMKPPEEVFPPRKAPQFDRTGRPFHYLFYSRYPHFNELCHEGIKIINELDKFEDQQIKQNKKPEQDDKIDLSDSTWLSKEEVENKIVETISDRSYSEYIKMMERIVAHPYSNHAKEFILRNRKALQILKDKVGIVTPKIGDDGRSYVTVYECRRKTARSDVTVISPGTGKISINGQDINYFQSLQSREQEIENEAVKFLTFDLNQFENF